MTTMKQLNNAVEQLNLETNNPTVSYASICLGNGERKYKAQVGNYYVDQAYGGYRLCQIVNEKGGATDIQPQRGTTNDCWNAVHTALNILRAQQ